VALLPALPPPPWKGGEEAPSVDWRAMALQRCVAVLGDGVALGQGCPKGESFVYQIRHALEPHGVEVVNWSKEEQTATCCATEQIDDLQAFISDAVATSSQTVVVIELGIHDRVFLGDMLPQALRELVRVVQNKNATPVVMQVVPDDVDQIVAEELGAIFVPAPASLVKQFAREPNHPFTPNASSHAELARNLLMGLEQALEIPLVSGGHGKDGRDTLLSGGQARSSRGGTPHQSKHRTVGHGSGFDGFWTHKDQPGLLECIQDGIIRSDDGTCLPIQPISHDCFFIEQGGQKVQAEVRGDELIWSDGDIWCRVEDNGVPTMGRPPEKKSKGDLKSFMKAWEKAEEACRQTVKEAKKDEVHSEKERLEHDRARLEQARQQLEDGMRTLHEETEKFSALREEVREIEMRQNRGLFGCCSAG